MERKRRGYGLALSSGRARIIGMLQSEMISRGLGRLISSHSNGTFVKHKLNRNEQICELKPVVLPRSEGSHIDEPYLAYSIE
jgi:hypothetical protein